MWGSVDDPTSLDSMKVCSTVDEGLGDITGMLHAVGFSGCAMSRQTEPNKGPSLLAENVFDHTRKSVQNGEPSQLFGPLYLWRFVVSYEVV